MLNPFKVLFFIDRQFLKIENFLLQLSLVSLLLFAFVQVFLRNFFDTAIAWGDVFNRLLVLWIGLFAATIGVKENKHLSLEILTKFLPDKAKPISDVFVNLFVIVVASALTSASWRFFQDQIEFESTDLLFQGVPKAYFTLIFPLGFGLITFRYVVRLLETIYRFGGGDKAYEKLVGTSCDDKIDISINIKVK